MNEYLIHQHQESIQHQARIAHLEQFVFEQWVKKLLQRFQKNKPSTYAPLALISADAACVCLF
jgi:hypothetical protein